MSKRTATIDLKGAELDFNDVLDHMKRLLPTVNPNRAEVLRYALMLAAQTCRDLQGEDS